MTGPGCRSRALFGASLEGHAPVRFVYVDEAGISQHEPVTVVAGIIVHADTKFVAIEEALDDLFNQHVPPKLRRGFIFHATKLYSGTTKDGGASTWAEGARWALLEGVLAIPRLLKLPVSVGICRRGKSVLPVKPPERGDHAEALLYCLAQADRFLRNFTPAHEVGSVVMEDAGKSRKVIDIIPDLLRKQPITLPPSMLLPGSKTGELMITKIRDGIYWQNKRQALFLQLADAWAFAWRLYLSSDKADGERLIRAAFGNRLLPRETFPGDVGGVCWRWSATGD